MIEVIIIQYTFVDDELQSPKKWKLPIIPNTGQILSGIR